MRALLLPLTLSVSYVLQPFAAVPEISDSIAETCDEKCVRLKKAAVAGRGRESRPSYCDCVGGREKASCTKIVPFRVVRAYDRPGYAPVQLAVPTRLFMHTGRTKQ